MSYLYPRAVQKPVPYATKAMSGSLGLVLHVQQGENSLANYFANPNNKAMSHFWVSKTGVVEQYKDGAFQSWAQESGNPTYHSVETEGYETTPLTEAQIEALAQLYVWGQQTFGWPLKLANKPGDRGLIYHAAGGAAWGNHPCPGPLRIAQRADILAAITPIPPAPTTGDDDMKRIIVDPSNPTWFLYDGFTKRPVHPGEQQQLAAMGLIPSSDVTSPVHKTTAEMAQIPLDPAYRTSAAIDAQDAATLHASTPKL